MGRKKYNLRSAKSDGVQTPILWQLSDDNKFLKNLLESDNAGAQPRSFDRLVVGSPSTSATKNMTSDTQTLINQSILQQLTAIGERLNKVEQKQ